MLPSLFEMCNCSYLHKYVWVEHLCGSASQMNPMFYCVCVAVNHCTIRILYFEILQLDSFTKMTIFPGEFHLNNK